MAATDKPIVFGAPYSVYVRAVRLALEEKGVAYELVPVDIFASDGPPPDFWAGGYGLRNGILAAPARAAQAASPLIFGLLIARRPISP
jgi:hypothetical protein